jgi:LmbE family N-acetylglucosaminyl deacetylase
MRLIAVGAHLDDVELACGGTLARATHAGHRVKMLVLSDSAYATYDGTVQRTIDEAIAEGMAAAEALGINDLEVLDFPTKDIPHHSSVVEAIERRLNDFRPDIIFSHWPFDTHQAHRGVGLSAVSASRWYNSVLMYEPIMPSGRSYVGFRPQIYVDISDHILTKAASLRAHQSQLAKYGEAWLEAVEARSRLRGFEAGVKHAEAFEAVRFELRL